jgi:membrane fusion protein, multidrug efflux system
MKLSIRKDRRNILIGLAGVFALAIIAAIVTQSLLGSSSSPGGRRSRGGDDGPVPVLVATASAADVPVYIDGVGTTRALNTVTVVSQVDGKLIKVAFKEGQDVERGYVLAEIDPTIYQAQYDQAVAKKAQDEAQLANVRIDLERYTRLAATNSATRQQADTQKALVQQLEAQVKQDQAAIDNAAATLGYTKIVAPIAGRTGIRQVDEGNIVRATNATAIVTITEIKPISMFFSLPQQELARINKAFSAGALVVEALGADNTTVVDRGTLRVVDNQVDQTTGTVKLKAEFPNAELQLWPGQFVNVRLLVDTLKGAIVVPTAAVQRGPNGTFVYVIDAESKAQVRPIKVAMLDDTRAVISDGLKSDERVVTTGFTRLSNGTKVNVQEREGQPQPAATSDVAPANPADAAPREGRRKREGAAKGEVKGGDSASGDGQDRDKERRRRKSENAETAPNPPSAKQ